MKQSKFNKYSRCAQLMPDRNETWHNIQTHIDRYLFAARFSEKKIVLDVACGSGYGSSYLQRNAIKVIGGDISKPAIEYAKSHYRKDGLHFLLLDAQQLPFPDSTFDVIVSMETIEHLPEYEHFLVECKRVLRSNGILICSTPNKTILSPNTKKTSTSAHFKEFYPGEFCQLLKKYFGEVTLYGHEPLNRIERVYFSLRKPLVPIIYAVPFISQIRKVLDFMRGLRSPSCRSVKLEEVNENDFAKIFSKNYFPLLGQGDLSSTWTIIGIAKK